MFVENAKSPYDNAIRGFSYALVSKRKNPVKLDWVPLCPSGHMTEPAKGMCIIIIHEQGESVKRKGLIVGEQKDFQNSVDLVHRI